MKPFVRFIRICSIVALGSASSLVACAGSSESEPTRSEAVTSASHGKHGGGARLMEKALDEVDLRPEQKAEVDKLKSEFKERHAPVKAAKSELMTALADQIERGKIDRCALDPQIEKVASAMAEAYPGDRAAFERLHGILDPEQRAKLVSALKQQFRSVEKAHDPSAIASAMATELKLTSDQKARVEKIFSGLREIRDSDSGRAEHLERWNKILEAFKGDRFVLDEVAPMKDVVAKATKKMEGLLWAGEAVLPVLNAEQRTLVAKALRDKARQHADVEESADEEPATD